MNIEAMMKAYGFCLWETGGGCTAYVKYGTAPYYLIITDEAQAPTDMDQPCTLGFQDDGDTLLFIDNITPSQILALNIQFP